MTDLKGNFHKMFRSSLCSIGPVQANNFIMTN